MAQSNIKAYTASAVAGTLSVSALAQDNQGGNNQGQNNDNQGGGAHGAPGPLMSAGLPVLLIGGGIYLMVRRKKR